jgi:4-hydroxy-tetrahydrodipicolinate synthase
VDTASLEQQIRFELAGGVHGLLLLGTIGEGQYVTMEERASTIATAVRVAGPHVPIVVGIHTCDLDQARLQLIQAKELGASAALVKYIGRPKARAAEVLGFYVELCDCHILPIFYYHYPSQTGLKLSAGDVANIVALPGVIGIKESTLNLKEVTAHVDLVRGQGKVFLSGTALNLTQFLAAGGDGAMCPEAVLLPGPTVDAYSAYQNGRCQEARCLQSHLFAVTPILRSRSSPPAMTRLVLMSAEDHHLPVPMGRDEPQARLKYALCCLGVPTSPVVKCPLPQLTEHERRRIERTIARLRAIDWCAARYEAPPVPLHICPEEEGGMLLRTGSFQLGPNVGRDLLRAQGDGESGF